MNTPGKKRISYQKDRRNTYGENDKSSRKSIRFRKRWINRVNRKRDKNAIQTIDFDTGDTQSYRNARKRWQKSPDEPLGYILQRRMNGRIFSRLLELYKEDESIFASLYEALIKSGMKEVGAKTTIRRLKSYIVCPQTFYSRNTKMLDEKTASNIIAFLDKYQTIDR